MRTLILTMSVLMLASCEHNEHPFEVWWSTSCGVEGAPSMITVFDKDFWQDNAGIRREYTGSVELDLAPELYDTYLWTVGINSRDGTAETVDLVHIPLPDDMVQEYNVRTLELELETYEEDPEEGAWTRMTGTCTYGGVTGELAMSQADDCDACIECSTIGILPPALVTMFPVILLLGGRVRRRRESDAG